MDQQQTATFFLAPRFTIKPPPEGPLQLGTIIDDLVNMEPLNESCVLPLPGKVYTHRASGFKAMRSEMESGKYGIWAKFMGLHGIGGQMNYDHSRSSSDLFKFDYIDEIAFTATKEYMLAGMNQDFVKQCVEGLGNEPVYMITGLKIARNPAVAFKMSHKAGVKMELGLKEPGGLQGFEVGPAIEHTDEVKQSLEWEKSDDFIFGFRVKRLYFKKALLSRKLGGFVGEHFHKGATLVDNDTIEEDTEKVQDVVVAEIKEGDGEMEGMEMIKTDSEKNKDGGSALLTTWVVPQIRA
ncbi:hypothetical protein ACHAPV_008862 [Trichoderma viride]